MPFVFIYMRSLLCSAISQSGQTVKRYSGSCKFQSPGQTRIYVVHASVFSSWHFLNLTLWDLRATGWWSRNASAPSGTLLNSKTQSEPRTWRGKLMAHPGVGLSWGGGRLSPGKKRINCCDFFYKVVSHPTCTLNSCCGCLGKKGRWL